MADGDPEDTELETPDSLHEPDLEDEPGDPTDEPEGESGDESEEDQGVAAQEQRSEPSASQPERRPSRENDRIRSLRDQVKDRDRQLADTNRRIDELIRQRQPQYQGETSEQRDARLALLTPQERMEETLRDATRNFEQRLNAMTVQNVETADRTAFQARVASDPFYAKWAPKVEALRAEVQARGGGFVERETALAVVLGRAMLEQRNSKEGRREVTAAKQRVAAQRTRPSNSGSDTQRGQRTDSSTARDRRLENLQI